MTDKPKNEEKDSVGMEPKGRNEQNPLPIEDAERAGDRAHVGQIVPAGCTGTSLSFEPGVLHVSKDGSGYIAIGEEHFTLEDDRCEGPDGPEGNVHWITRMDVGEMLALRDFLNGPALSTDQVSDVEVRDQIARIVVGSAVKGSGGVSPHQGDLSDLEDGWFGAVAADQILALIARSQPKGAGELADMADRLEAAATEDMAAAGYSCPLSDAANEAVAVMRAHVVQPKGAGQSSGETRPDIVQWQTDQSEWFQSPVIEIVTEYAEWRDRQVTTDNADGLSADRDAPAGQDLAAEVERLRKGLGHYACSCEPGHCAMSVDGDENPVDDQLCGRVASDALKDRA